MCRRSRRTLPRRASGASTPYSTSPPARSRVHACRSQKELDSAFAMPTPVPLLAACGCHSESHRSMFLSTSAGVEFATVSSPALKILSRFSQSWTLERARVAKRHLDVTACHSAPSSRRRESRKCASRDWSVPKCPCKRGHGSAKRCRQC